MKPHVAAHFPGTGLQSEDFVEFAIRFSLRKGRLWNQISQVLLGFCSAYIYPIERFFSQLFNDVFNNFISFIVF
jgi:hypothetical protein